MWFRDQRVGVLLTGHACGFHRYVDIFPTFQSVPQIFPGAVISSDFLFPSLVLVGGNNHLYFAVLQIHCLFELLHPSYFQTLLPF